MKSLIGFSFFIIAVLSSNAQWIDQSIIKLRLNDTLFIERYQSETDYHCIFLDTNRQSINYKKVYTTYKDISEVKKEAQVFKEEQDVSTKKLPSYLQQTWRVLRIKNNTLYNYLPGDWCGFFEFTIPNRELLLDGWCDGTIGSLVVDYELLKGRIHHISGIMVGLPNKKTHHYLVKVDMKNGIYALFNDLDQKTPEELMKSTDYRLIVPRQFMKRFPLIVNYSKYNKPLEYSFDSYPPLCEWFKICK